MAHAQTGLERPAPHARAQRRVHIADAALLVLAREGARGLTHRAVDAQLRLPSGSTSYYFRTRAALLSAAAERLAVLDMADLDPMSSDAAGVGSLLERWLAPEARMRSLARMELLLASARDPDLACMARARARFIERAVRARPGARAADPRARATATALVALVDGLILHGLVTGHLDQAAAKHTLERLLTPMSRATRPERARASGAARAPQGQRSSRGRG